MWYLVLKGRRARRGLGPIGIAAVLLAVAFSSACSGVPKTGVIVAGSTSVQPFAELLAEEYMTQHADVRIDVQGGGSAAGIMAAVSGTADIGMSSRELKADEKGLWNVEIARDGLAVIVHPSNRVRDLTLDQVRDVYAARIRRWSQLGGPVADIHVVTREEGSGTRGAFESLVMGKVEITARAIVQDSNGAVRQLVADDPSAIGFISLGLVSERVKAVRLGGVEATRENVIDGRYGLFRPFLFIAKAQPGGRSGQFIDFVRSAEGRRLLSAEGLVALGEEGGK